MKNRKEAIEDAISATKAALAEGIVPGGGLALLRLIDALGSEEARSTGDERTGLSILRKAAEAPARQIAENSSVDAGIIDPTTVVRIALENAVSVASVLLLAEATLTERPETKKTATTAQETLD